MNKFIVFTALLSVAAAQLRCDTPPAWEARFMEVSTGRERFARISYDAENTRIRIIEDEVFSDEQDFYDELFLHKEQLGYRLNLKTKVCEKFKLTEPFREIGVPLGARLDGEVEIGTAAIPGAGVLTQIYEADTPRGFYAGEWIPLDHTCLPVSDTYFDRTNRLVTHWSIFDVIGGIKDPNVFNPPPECM